jgi:hypothetical protein
MARPRCAAKTVADPAHADLGGIAVRIDLVRRRCPQQFHARCLEQGRIGSFLARIGLQILPLAKLRRIDKDRRHHRVALLHCRFDQAHMPRMQRSHGRDQPDPVSGLAEFRPSVPQRVKLSNNLHASLFVFRFCCKALLSYATMNRPSQGPTTGVLIRT